MTIKHCRAHFSILAGLILAGLMLAGCGIERVSSSQNWVPGTHSVYTYAAEAGEMTTLIFGNPFFSTRPETVAAVTEAMSAAAPPPRVRFTTEPSSRTRDGYRMVVLFDPAHGLPDWWLCAYPEDVRIDPEPDRLHVLIGFCADRSLQSSVRGSIDRVSSPTTPRSAPSSPP